MTWIRRATWPGKLILLGVLAFAFEVEAAKQIFTYNNRNLPSTIDPAVISDVYSRNVLNQIFEGLTTNNPEDFSPAPGVATKWTISEDGLVYTFFLNENAKWSDGSAVTASDFVFAWRRVLNPKVRSPYVNHLFKIKNGRKFHKGDLKNPADLGVQAVSPTVLKVTLEHPTPYFLQLTSFYTLFPLQRALVEKEGKAWSRFDKVVCNGPFKVAGYAGRGKERYIRLVRNPHYWNQDQYNLEEVHIYGIQDAELALKLYRQGRLDYTGETELPTKSVAKWRYTKDFKIVPWFNVNFIRFNVDRKPFDDKRVRQAFAYALDREKITRYLVQGNHTAAASFVPQGITGYEPPQEATFNLGKARKLFAAAGYCLADSKAKRCKPFPKVTFLLDNNSVHLKLALGMQQILKSALGIDSIDLKVAGSLQEYLALRRQQSYDIARSGWAGDYYDPNTFLELWSSDNPNNHTGWSHPKYDQWITAAESEKNTRKRMRFFSKAERLLLEEMPVVPVFHYSKVYLMKHYVKNYFDNIQRVLTLRNVYIDHYAGPKS